LREEANALAKVRKQGLVESLPMKHKFSVKTNACRSTPSGRALLTTAFLNCAKSRFVGGWIAIMLLLGGVVAAIHFGSRVRAQNFDPELQGLAEYATTDPVAFNAEMERHLTAQDKEARAPSPCGCWKTRGNTIVSS
jgi:hypothetical protein